MGTQPPGQTGGLAPKWAAPLPRWAAQAGLGQCLNCTFLIGKMRHVTGELRNQDRHENQLGAC